MVDKRIISYTVVLGQRSLLKSHIIAGKLKDLRDFSQNIYKFLNICNIFNIVTFWKCGRVVTVRECFLFRRRDNGKLDAAGRLDVSPEMQNIAHKQIHPGVWTWSFIKVGFGNKFKIKRFRKTLRKMIRVQNWIQFTMTEQRAGSNTGLTIFGVKQVSSWTFFVCRPPDGSQYWFQTSRSLSGGRGNAFITRQILDFRP